MEAWILVNTHAGRQRARQNGEQIRRVFALGGARTRLAYTESPQEGEAFWNRRPPPSRTCWFSAGAMAP